MTRRAFGEMHLSAALHFVRKHLLDLESAERLASRDLSLKLHLVT